MGGGGEGEVKKGPHHLLLDWFSLPHSTAHEVPHVGGCFPRNSRVSEMDSVTRDM